MISSDFIELISLFLLCVVYVLKYEHKNFDRAQCLTSVLSVSDFMYRHNVTFDSVTTEVEILDTCKCAVSLTFIVRIFTASSLLPFA